VAVTNNGPGPTSIDETVAAVSVENSAASVSNVHKVAEIESPEKDVHEFISIAQGIKVRSGKDTYMSLPVNRINLPEVKNEEATFVYNYFTKDERVRTVGNASRDKILDLQLDFSNEIFFQIKNDKLPRYVKLTFQPPKLYGIIKKSSISNIIMNNLDKINIEGANSNDFFTGIEMIDSGKEMTLYHNLKSTLFFKNIGIDKDSPSSAANKLFDSLNDNNGMLIGNNKKLLKEAMSKSSAEGYVYAPTDIKPEIAKFASDPLTKQSINCQFNNLTFYECVQSAIRIPDKVFQDEFRALSEVSRDLKRNVLNSTDPTQHSDAHYEIEVKAVSITPLDSSNVSPPRIDYQQASGNTGDDFTPLGTAQVSVDQTTQAFMAKFPKISITGYMIQKYENLNNGTTNFLGSLYSDNPNGLYVLDKEVRYGGSYTYKIRSMYEIDTIVRVESIDKTNNAIQQLAIAKILLASKGRKISTSCFEKVPPPPPENFRIGFNFSQKLPYLTWQFPVNPQRDIKKFQIFKRLTSGGVHALKKPFTLIAEIDFDNSIVKSSSIEKALIENTIKVNGPRVNFLDKDFILGTEPIYSIASIDAHGMSSNYGAQIKMKYNKFKNKIETTLISPPGAPKPYPNLNIQIDAFEDAMKVSGYERMKIFLDPEYYKVLKNTIEFKGNNENIVEKSLDHIRVNPNEDTYKVSILNIDLQKDKNIGIKIIDASGAATINSPAAFSLNNLSFEFGV
jgi:hypothetical protein